MWWCQFLKISDFQNWCCGRRRDPLLFFCLLLLVIIDFMNCAEIIRTKRHHPPPSDSNYGTGTNSSKVPRLVTDELLPLKVNNSNSNDSNSINNNNDNNNNRNVKVNCDNVRPFLQLRNVSVSSPGNHYHTQGSICGGHCCSDEAEGLLRKQGQNDFAALLRHNSRSLQGLLSFTGATIQNHVSNLAYQSQNKTLLLLSQVYNEMAVLSHRPIDRLYDNMRLYILANHTKLLEKKSSSSGSSVTTISSGSTTSIPLSSTGTIDLRTVVNQAFADLFPLVYHNILVQSENDSATEMRRDFSDDYKNCLRKSVELVVPFGEIPNQIANSLETSLETTRVLLQALRIGVEVLNVTDTVLIEQQHTSSDCYDALLRMTYCPKCQGLVRHTKPCSGYCLNVLRGCLTRYVAELDAPWTGYVESIESLTHALQKGGAETATGGGYHSAVGRFGVDLTIRSLDTRISNAIMYAIGQKTDIHNKVKANCGPAHFVDKATVTPNGPNNNNNENSFGKLGRSINHHHSHNFPVTVPLSVTGAQPSMSDMQLSDFRTYIGKTKGFYGNLADTLCQDKSFAEPNDQRCWNGERIAEYTKTVVDVGLDMQKYNPEVKITVSNQQDYVDPKIGELVAKLRHVHHLTLSSIGGATINSPEVDYMQRDGADGGSGSGAGPDFDDSDDDYTRGSGSGNGHIVVDEDGEPTHRKMDGTGIIAATVPNSQAPSLDPKVVVDSSAKAFIIMEFPKNLLVLPSFAIWWYYYCLSAF